MLHVRGCVLVVKVVHLQLPALQGRADFSHFSSTRLHLHPGDGGREKGLCEAHNGIPEQFSRVRGGCAVSLRTRGWRDQRCG